MSKSTEMPEPKVLNYDLKYRISQLFINDLKKVLANVAYVDAIKMLDKIERNERIFTLAQLNEFILELSSFPYKDIVPLMAVLNQHGNFFKYFEEIDVPEVLESQNQEEK